MANKRVQLVPSGAGTPTREDTNTGEWDFGSVRIGEDNLALTQDGTGVAARLAIGSRITANEGTEANDLVTKSQAESYAGGLVGALTASEGLTRVGDDFQIALDGVTQDKIADDAVGADQIADDAVGTSHIADDAVTQDQIADAAVGTDQLIDDAVTQDKIGDAAVGTDQLIDDAVTQDKIADDAVGSDQLATDSVTADAIAAGAVGNEELADEAVTGNKLNTAFRARLGIDGDLTYEAYTSTAVIATDDTYPEALSSLDDAVNTILTNVAQEEIHTVVTPGGITSLLLTTMTFAASIDIPDITVRVNGKHLTQSTTANPNKDFDKSGTDTLNFSFTVPEGAEIVVRKERTGAVAGSGGGVAVEKDGASVVPFCTTVNFTGAGVTVSDLGGGQANVNIPGGGGGTTMTLVKRYKNTSGADIDTGKALAFGPTGGIVLADANITDLADFAGVSSEFIGNGNYGTVYKLGECPNVLLGLGASYGDMIYLGETPGEFTLVAPGGETDTIILVGRAELADSVEPGNPANTLYLYPQYIMGP